MRLPRLDPARTVACIIAAAAMIVALTSLSLHISSFLAVPTFRSTPAQQQWTLHVAMKCIASLIAAVMAIIIAMHTGRQQAQRLLALAMSGAALAQALESSSAAPLLVYGAFLDWYPPRAVFDRGVLALYAFGTALALAASLRWTQLYPSALSAGMLSTRGIWRLVRVPQQLILRPAVLWALFGGVPLAALLLHGTALDLTGPWSRLFFVALTAALATANLKVGYDRADDEQRRRIFWVFEAVLVATICYAAALSTYLAHVVLGFGGRITEWGSFVLYPLGTIALYAMLAFAVLYRGAVDSKLVVRRTAAYGALGVTMTVVFVALEGALTSLVVVRFALPDQVGSLIAGSTLAVCFGPIRKQVEHLITRVLNRLMPPESVSVGVVVAAELEDYATLARDDEPTALALVSLFHAAARASAMRSGGTPAPMSGATVLLRFTDADAALAASLALQQQLHATAQALGIPPLPVRCGIDHGDIAVAADGELLGSAASLARARLAAAEPGTVLASARIVAGNANGEFEFVESRDGHFCCTPSALMRR
jgi:hypothetical protein